MLDMGGMEQMHDERMPSQALATPELRKDGWEKGDERRKALAARVSKFFSGFTDKVTKGINFVLGSPEIVADKFDEIVGTIKEKIDPAQTKFFNALERGKQTSTEKLQVVKEKAKLHSRDR